MPPLKTNNTVMDMAVVMEAAMHGGGCDSDGGNGGGGCDRFTRERS